MGCKKCEDEPGRYPIRLGNKEIGWGTVIVEACVDHFMIFQRMVRHFSEERERLMKILGGKFV